MTERAGQRVKTYSGGMKRRINIGVGLLHKPRVLFMDEPTVGIDPQSRRAILDTVMALNQEGMTVLYTTHYMEEAQELSHRVGIVDHGRMIALGTQRELTQQIGQHEALRLRVDACAECLTEALRTVPSVLQTSCIDSDIVVMVPNASEALPAVVGAAGALGIKIRSIDIEEPNLETVFLHLTGKALRD